MPSPNTLRERIEHRLARELPFRRTADIAPQRPIVSFTFDDVPVTALSHGAGLLEAHGARGTFYVAGGLAGRQHDGQLMLGDGDYRELAARGHEIAHHSHAHRTPATLGCSFAHDLAQNDAYLATVTAAPARNYAFPYGRSSPGARRHVGRRFRSSRGIAPGINRRAADLDLLLAVEMHSRSTAADLTRWIDAAGREPGWLIYFTHDVQPTPSPFGVHPELFDAVLAHAVASGCEVLTVDNALDRLEIDVR